MKDKSLASKAVDIKGKKYVPVAARIKALSSEYEGKYSIDTDAIFYPDVNMWVVKASLTWMDCVYVGHAQEIVGEGYINKTSALENCETSAVGRACAMAGIGVIDDIASSDEVEKDKERKKYEKSITVEKEWLNEDDMTEEQIMLVFSKHGKKTMKAIRQKYKVSRPVEQKIKDIIMKKSGEIIDERPF